MLLSKLFILLGKNSLNFILKLADFLLVRNCRLIHLLLYICSEGLAPLGPGGQLFLALHLSSELPPCVLKLLLFHLALFSLEYVLMYKTSRMKQKQKGEYKSLL
ncbi:hypothetical protein ACOSP7_028297 [Xanthoceras sorbifolium]